MDAYEKMILNFRGLSNYWPGDGDDSSTGIFDVKGQIHASTVLGSPNKGSQPIVRRGPGVVKNGNFSVNSNGTNTNGFTTGASNVTGGADGIIGFTFMMNTIHTEGVSPGDWICGQNAGDGGSYIFLSVYPSGVNIQAKPTVGIISTNQIVEVKPNKPYHCMIAYRNTSAVITFSIDGGETFFNTIGISGNMGEIAPFKILGDGTTSFNGRIERVWHVNASITGQCTTDFYKNVHKVWLRSQKFSNKSAI